MLVAWMMETIRRVAVLVGEPGKRVKGEDACLHAAEEMFFYHVFFFTRRSEMLGTS